jgi:spermidine synthase
MSKYRHKKISSEVKPVSREASADRMVFYFTAFTTGAAVMMIELLGTRIIGPYYGVSLVVWTSLLSIALLSLSVGYLVGGQLADRSRLRLSHIILLAAVAIGVIPLFSKPVQIAMNTLGLRAGALASAFILFSVPLTLLGMVGPFVIKLATEKLDVLGTTAGKVYAISTMGSVVGTLLLGFFLLPLVGTQTVVLALSLTLALLAFCLNMYESRRMRLASSRLPIGTAAMAFAAVQVVAMQSDRSAGYDGYEVLFEDETHYGWVRVIDQPSAGIRWLMSDSSTIGAEALANGTSLLGYQQVVKQLPWFNRHGSDALLIGLGSGHLVNEFSRLGVKTDAIEIDPAVAYVADKFFSYKPTGDLKVGDARYQIKSLDKQYDFIVHDCFTGGSEPIHLLSQEMLQELKSLLKPGGILAVNFVGFTQGDPLPVASLARTLDSTFSHRRTFVSSPESDFNDFIFLVSDKPVSLAAKAKEEGVGDMLTPHEVSVSAIGGKIITDDFNPLERLQLTKAEHYRNVLLQRVGEDILFR